MSTSAFVNQTHELLESDIQKGSAALTRHVRWRVHGLGLPDDVLRKLYYENALKRIPGPAGDLEAIFPSEDTP